MLWQSGWRITTFCHKIYIFGFHLLEAILKVKSTCKACKIEIDEIEILNVSNFNKL